MTWPTPDLAATRAAVDRNLSRCMELIETDPARALQAADAARAAMQDLFYQVWRRHHTSGAGRATR